MKKCLLLFLITALCLYLLAPLGCMLPPEEAKAASFAPSEPLSDALLDALLDEAETIDLTPYRASEEEVHHAYSRLYATEPALFFISPAYALSRSPDGSIAYLRPTYRLAGDARLAAEADMAARIAAIVLPLRDLSPVVQVAYLHDYMITHYTYDSDYRVYDSYTLLKTGRGVCQAYALLFTSLCRALNIPACPVTCFEMSHEWNMVMLNGEWYHIDLIWDDTDLAGEIDHTYFLIGDEELRARRALRSEAWDTAYSWEAPETAPGIRTLSAPWRSYALPFLFTEGTVRFSLSEEQLQINDDLTCTPLP